jgi:hypothetical protein
MKKKNTTIFLCAFNVLFVVLGFFYLSLSYRNEENIKQTHLVLADMALIIFLFPYLITYILFNPATWVYLRNPIDPDKPIEFDITTAKHPYYYHPRLHQILFWTQIVAYTGFYLLTTIVSHVFDCFGMLLAIFFFTSSVYNKNQKFFNDKKALAIKKSAELMLPRDKNEEKIDSNLAI